MEYSEHIVKLGFQKSPEHVFNEIEAVISAMNRCGWEFIDSCVEGTLENIHLFFQKELVNKNGDNISSWVIDK